jgi:two-component system, NarL family, nitrate/nitrite response regulator NarL
MKLTSRQREIAELAALGLTNKVIARQLDITEGTVKAHMHKILAQLGISSRAVLAARWRPDRGHVSG